MNGLQLVTKNFLDFAFTGIYAYRHYVRLALVCLSLFI